MCASIIIVSFSNIYTASNFGVSSFLSLSRHHEKDHAQIPEREPNNMAYTPMLPFPASRHSAIVPRLCARRIARAVHRKPPTFLVKSAGCYAIYFYEYAPSIREIVRSVMLLE